MKKAFLVIGSIVCGIAACKKESTPQNPIIGKWVFDKVIYFTIENGIVTNTEIQTGDSLIRDCDKDNFFAYLENGRGYNTNGVVLCDGQVSSVDSFYYTLSPDYTTLKVHDDHPEKTYYIKSLTASQMVRNDTFLTMRNAYLTAAEVYFRKIP